MDTDYWCSDVNGNCTLNNCGQSFQTSILILNTECEWLLHIYSLDSGPLILYTGNPVMWQSLPDIIQAHFMIKATGLPNYLACTIPIRSYLKCQNWSKYLHSYWDRQLVDLLTFGFLWDFNGQTQLISTEENHASLVQNPLHVEKYIMDELQHQAILGPFDKKPIPSHISPLMVRDKQDSDNKRTIMDLSWPKGQSVNDGARKDIYLGMKYILRYPLVDSIAASLGGLGPAAMIYKVDISRAFRQIKVDLRDIDLVWLTFKNKYFLDLSILFGYQNGSQIFQRCTNAIQFIMTQHGFRFLH